MMTDRRRYSVYSSQHHVKRRRRRIALCLVGAVALITLAIVGGSITWFVMKVHETNSRIDAATKQALSDSPATTLVQAKSTGTMDILLVGSDARPGSTIIVGARSDVQILLHVDYDNNRLSILSIPRDTYVNIPGHGQNRMNAAYAYGGAALTIKTIKNYTGVNITKYVEIGFQAFTQVVDSLGGVYVDVDRKYNGDPAGSVKVDAGFQRLTGYSALMYSRYRYDGNGDFGRMARQQLILSSVREQIMKWNLPLKLPGLVNTLMNNITTNLSASDIFGLGYWLEKLDSSRITQIVLEGSTAMTDGMSVVMIDQDTLKTAVSDFYSGIALASSGTTETTAQGGTTDSTASTSATDSGQGSGVTGVPNKSMWTKAQAGVPFALEAPSYVCTGYSYDSKRPSSSGVYDIVAGDKSKPAVRMLYRYKDSAMYIGVTATTWLDAPIAAKGTKVTFGGVDYTVVRSSNKVSQIWWKKDGVLYFISNNLFRGTKESELLKMAESMKPVSNLG